MSMDLHSTDGDWFKWSNIAWSKVLYLASVYGWEPAGTKPPPWWDRPTLSWQGLYQSNDGGLVTMEDARAVAGALEKALDDIPDHNEMPDKIVTYRIGETSGEPVTDALLAVLDGVSAPNAALNPFEFFGGKDKLRVKDFVTFCRKGGFYIW